MHASLGYAVERMPTNGVGGTVAALGTASTVISAVSETTVTLAGNLAGIDVGTLILTSTGCWTRATGVPAGAVVPIEPWKNRLVKNQVRNDGSRMGALPIAGTDTYKAFVGAAVLGNEGGWYIKKAQLTGVLASTLVINGPTGALALTIPSAIATPTSFDYGRGVFIPGPFTIVPSSAGVLGTIEFRDDPQ